MPTLNVLDFGATGDGATDDQPAIQAALDAVPVDGVGATVFVPAGDYRLGDTLVIRRDHTTLKGEGPTSVLRLMDDALFTVLMMPRAQAGGQLAPALFVSHILVEDLCLDANNNEHIMGEGDIPNYFGCWVWQAEDVTFRRVEIRNSPTEGITFGNGNRPIVDFLLEDCWIHHCSRNAIHVAFVDGGTIRRCRTDATPSHHYGLGAAHAVDIEVEGYDYYGGDPFYPFVKNCVVEDCLFTRIETNSSGNAVALQDAYGYIDGVIIRRNVCVGWQESIQINGVIRPLYGREAGVMDVTIEDNWFSSGTATLAEANAFLAESGLDAGGAAWTVSGVPMTCVAASGVVIRRNVINDTTRDTINPALPRGGYSHGAMLLLRNSLHTTIEDNVVRLYEVIAIHGMADCALARDDVAVSGNSLRVADGVIAEDTDGTTTDLVVAGDNVDISGGTWDYGEPACSLDVVAGSILSDPTDVTVTATDATSAIARVYFFIDGIPVGLSDAAPHVFAVAPAALVEGPHVLAARAVDAQAVLGDMAEVDVTVGLSGSGSSSSVLLFTSPSGGILLYSR